MKDKLHNVILLTGPTRSGKTTALAHFVADKAPLDGFLTPDEENIRILITLQDREKHAFEVATPDSQQVVSIGQFQFLSSGFEKGKDALKNRAPGVPHWMVVDELGPLEMRGEGFEPALSDCIYGNEKSGSAAILIVVRNSLTTAFSLKYGEPACMINPDTLIRCTQTAAVILCGGQSSRMGQPKALLQYHGNQPQYQVTANLFKNITAKIFIANGALEIPVSETYQLIEDDAPDQGPAAGVLSAFRKNKGHLLVCGCDYPLLHLVDLMRLMAVDDSYLAVCYEDESASFADPLLCFYHESCLPLMEAWYREGNRSLRHFLKTIPHKVLKPTLPNRIKSIDTPEAFLNLTIHQNGAR